MSIGILIKAPFDTVDGAFGHADEQARQVAGDDEVVLTLNVQPSLIAADSEMQTFKSINAPLNTKSIILSKVIFS